ncbi:MAG TPA: hypothetical protein VHY76_10315 [Acetobacteraceae bacterium]|nr:hypothetical protein [Acetobacteraceae bacterium]
MAVDLIALTPQQIAAGALSVVPTAIAISSALVAVLPVPVNQRTLYAFVWRIMDYVALNFANGTTAVRAMAKGHVVPAPEPFAPVPVAGPPAAPKA